MGSVWKGLTSSLYYNNKLQGFFEKRRLTKSILFIKVYIENFMAKYKHLIPGSTERIDIQITDINRIQVLEE